jgi:two-component system, response regulator
MTMTAQRSSRVLLVEDSPSDAELTLRALRSRPTPHDVTWVRDGAEALDFLFRTGRFEDRPDEALELILLDLKLPKVDGIQVLGRVKGEARFKCVPVVVLSSSAEDRDLERAYELGANSYLVKPVDFDEFVEVVGFAGGYWLEVNRHC